MKAIMNAPLLVLLVLSPINLLLHYLLILHPSTAIGFLGAPIASCTISYLILCCYVLYIRFVQGGAAWGGFSIDALNISMMWEFIRLGVPGVIMLASEWWAFEIMALIAGILGKNSLAAQSILMSTYSLTYMIPLGISVACTSVVGNALGAGDQRMAQLASRASLALGLSIGFFIGVVLFLVRHQWSYLWNDDQEVAQLVATIIPFLSFFQLSDAISAICNSVFLGTGKQKLGAVMNIAAYYVLGLPLGWYLAFHPMGMTGLMGMWVGLESALLVLSIVQMGFIITLDWNHEVLVAKQRLSLENEGYSPISIHDEEEAFFDAE
jgi:MATE family multidrug resistance protein